MRRYSILHAPFLSWYSKPFYRDVGERWGLSAFAYLLILLALSWLPALFAGHRGWSRFMETKAPVLLQEMPSIEISDGVVWADPPGPTYLADPGTRKVFAIVDTTGEVTSLEFPGALALLTRSHVFLRKSPVEVRTYDLSRVRHFELDRTKLRRWLDLASVWGPPFLFALVLWVSFLYRLAQALLFGAAGLVFDRRSPRKLRYWQSVRLSIMAVSPTILLKTAMQSLGLTFPLDSFLLFAIALAYLWFGVTACAEEEEEARGECPPV